MARTVVNTAVNKLRRAIMQGKLRPGQKLVENALSREMGVSRPSVREALRALERERLIELVPNRGPYVARLGRTEIEEIHDVWAMLTGEALFRFAGVATSAEITVLKHALTSLERALDADDALAQLAATNQFFGLALARSGNSVLIEIVTALVSRLNFLRAQALRYEGWGYLCVQEISDIIAALEARDADAARAATRRHIDSACAAAKQTSLLPVATSPTRAASRNTPLGTRGRPRARAQTA